MNFVLWSLRLWKIFCSVICSIYYWYIGKLYFTNVLNKLGHWVILLIQIALQLIVGVFISCEYWPFFLFLSFKIVKSVISFYLSEFPKTSQTTLHNRNSGYFVLFLILLTPEFQHYILSVYLMTEITHQVKEACFYFAKHFHKYFKHSLKWSYTF